MRRKPFPGRFGWLALAAAVLAAVVGQRWWKHRLDHSQDDPLYAAARRYGVEPALVKAVAWHESRFDPNARGRAGEIGLMQVTDPAAQEWAESENHYPLPESHLFDPRTNALAGTWYLRKLLNRYRHTDDPLPFALADYNAGRANVLKWMESEPQAKTKSRAFRAAIGFASTRRYVDGVLDRRRYYQRRPRRRSSNMFRPARTLGAGLHLASAP